MTALTTAFTPAASCLADIYTSGIYYSIGGPNPEECFPDGWASTSQYFSPGICPEGYTVACSATALLSGGAATETQATCCPSSYKCYTESAFNFPGQACVSLIESSSTRTVIIASVTSVVEDELATLHPLTEAVNGYGVSIRYQLADFLITATATATATSTAGHGTAVLTSTATSTAAALPTQTAGFGDTVASAKHDSASQSLKIIVPIVIVALVLLSAALIWVCVRRSKRKARREDDGVNGRVLGELEGHGAMPRYSGMLGVGGRKEAGRVVHEFYAPPAEMAG